VICIQVLSSCMGPINAGRQGITRDVMYDFIENLRLLL
jgi:hypothetical protein